MIGFNTGLIRNVVLAAAFALLSAVASAATLDEAKANGWVGEQVDGYLGVVTKAKEAMAVVDDINAKRRAEYERIAESNKIDLKQVEALAGKKAIEKTAPGNYVLVDGEWRKK